MNDPLAEDWAVALTAQVRALLLKEKTLVRQINEVRAKIGALCLRMKAKLKGIQGAYGRWMAANIHPDRSVSKQYVDVAVLREKFVDTYQQFRDFEPCKLARIAALPHAISAKLTPDTVLPIPGTDLRLALKNMGYPKLDRALDALEGRRPKSKTTSRLQALVAELEDWAKKDPAAFEAQMARLQTLAQCGVEPLPAEREARAQQAIEKMQALKALLAAVNGAPGKLLGATKREGEEAWEANRGEILRWKAWSTPRRKAPLSP